MSNTSIQLKKSGISGNTPSDLSHGELAINYADGRLYYKDSSNFLKYIYNQNSFDTIGANGQLIIASSGTDTLTFNAGVGVNIIPDVYSKSIEINSTDAVYAATHANAAFLKANDAYTLIVNGGGGGLPVGGVYLDREYTGTGYTSDFTVTDGVTEASVLVAINGVLQRPVTDYTILGTVLSLTDTPPLDTIIQIRELGSNVDEIARSTANSAWAAANSSSSGFSSTQANSAFLQANLAFDSANSNALRVESAFQRANDALVEANVGVNFIYNGGTIYGSVSITQDLNISGNIVIGGNSTSISSNNLTLTDSLIYLADENAGNVADIGIIGAYTDAGGYNHLGLIRDADDGVWKLFSNVASEPSGTVVDLSNARYDTLRLGGVIVDGEANVGTTLFVGSSQGTPLGGATNPIIGALGSANGYIQNYTYNTANGSSSSTDVVVYPDNGTDAYGWLDMGITSNNYSDATFSVTGRNEGYLFMSAPLGSGTSGNLVIATDSTGIHNAIEVFINGYSQGKESPAFVINSNEVRTNKKIVFVDGTSQNTAAASLDYTNSVFEQANGAFDVANNASLTATASFIQANTATSDAAVADSKAVTAGSYANSAYDQANTATSNASTADSKAVTAGSYANSAFIVANTALTDAGIADSKAVTAGSYANSAFIVANTATDSVLSAASYANSSFIKANSAYSSQNVTGTYANAAYTQANTATSDAAVADSKAVSAGSYANTAYTHAIAAFDEANTKLSLSGGTITGPVIINSDLTVTGNVSYTGNVTNVTITGNTGQFFGDSSNGFQALYAGIPLGYTFQEQTVLQATGSYDGFVQINLQNIDPGFNSSSDLVATNDNQAGDSYIDVGINSTTYNNPLYTIQKAGDGYVYVGANTDLGGGNLVFSTTTTGKDIVFSTAGTLEENEIARFKDGVGLVMFAKPITFADGTAQNTAASPAIHTEAAFLHANAAFAAANTGGGGGGITYTSSVNPPSTPSVGDQWYSTTEDILYEYITDGTSNFWLDTSSNSITTSDGSIPDYLDPFLLAGL